MICPYCKGEDSYVSKTEHMFSGNVRRYRKCTNCLRMFSTIEALSVREKQRVRKEKMFMDA